MRTAARQASTLPRIRPRKRDWDIQKPLDEYMSLDVEDQELVISILDTPDTSRLERRPDIHEYQIAEHEVRECLSYAALATY